MINTGPNLGGQWPFLLALWPPALGSVLFPPPQPSWWGVASSTFVRLSCLWLPEETPILGSRCAAALPRLRPLGWRLSLRHAVRCLHDLPCARVAAAAGRIPSLLRGSGRGDCPHPVVTPGGGRCRALPCKADDFPQTHGGCQARRARQNHTSRLGSLQLGGSPGSH